MGYLLRRQLADAMPDWLTASERLVALEIADLCHDSTREGYGADLLEAVARRSGLANVKQVGRVLGELSAHGLELRVPLGVDSSGRPLFARRGRQTTYRVPDLEGLSTKVPASRDLTEEKGPGLPGVNLDLTPGTGTDRSRLTYPKVPGGRDPTAVPQAPELASWPSPSSNGNPSNGRAPVIDAVGRALEAAGFDLAQRPALEQYLAEKKKGAGVVVAAQRDGDLPALLEGYRRWAVPVSVPPPFGEADRARDCGCSSGWLGEDDVGRPIPCPVCKQALLERERW